MPHSGSRFTFSLEVLWNGVSEIVEEQERVLFIEARVGMCPEAKKTLMQQITAAVDDIYYIRVTQIFLREYPAENVAMDGKLQSENPRILEALTSAGGDRGRQLADRLRGFEGTGRN
jgi:hypothetical protein